MPFGISQETRNQVIREWLAGEPRDKIASDTELAAGTITNSSRLEAKVRLSHSRCPTATCNRSKKTGH